MRELQSPPWPEDLGAIDTARAAKGAALYEDHCAKCHDAKSRDPQTGDLVLRTIAQQHMGTDEKYLDNYLSRRVDTGILGAGNLAVWDALTAVTTAVTSVQYAELGLTPEQIDEYNGHEENVFQGIRKLRPRPLNGAWASAPYLHNGSVPNMYQLLGPASERDPDLR